MKIYIASRWSRQPYLRQVRDQLHANTSLRVVSRWIDAERPTEPDEEFFMSEEGKLRLARDLADIRESKLLVADILEGMGRRGGMNIEIGYAVGLGKPVILIGDPSKFGVFGHVFMRHFADWDDAFLKNF